MRFTLHRDKVERKIQTGHTSYECRRSCYLHCGANLRKASPPSGVGLVKGTTTGSSISLSWNQPSDTGGRYACISICLSDGMSGARFLWLCTSAALLCVTVASVHTRVALWLCSPILYYSVLYLPRRGQEEVDRTSGPETTLTLKNLPSEYEISWVKVRAVTKVVDADHCVHLIFYFTFLSNIFALGHTTYKRQKKKAQFGAGEHSAPLLSISTAAPSAPSAARAFRVTAKTFHSFSLHWELPEDSGGR